jgi:mono/diheme cytochrome c family protein
MHSPYGVGKFRALGAAIAFLLSAALLPHDAVAQQGEAVAEGARVYGATCGRCHNPRSPLERSDRDWVTIVNHMRVRGNLTGEEYRSVLAFLQATNTDPRERSPLPGAALPPVQAVPAKPGGGPVSTDPETIRRGETLVKQKACLGCHTVRDAGGQVGPTLNGVVGRRGPDYVRKKLSDPTFDNQTSMMPNFGLSPEEIEAILAFLATLDGQGP